VAVAALHLFYWQNCGFYQSIKVVEGAGLIPWVGGPPNAFFEFYLREAFQSQTNTEKITILYNNGAL